VKASPQIRAIKADDWSAYIEDRRKAMTESELQQTIIDTLVFDGWLVLRVNGGGMSLEDRYVVFSRWTALGYGEFTKGVADVLAFRPDAKPLAVECKVGKNQPTAEQEYFLQAWEQAGGDSIVARQLEDLQPYLQRMVVQ
jgi:hypothetical protein